MSSAKAPERSIQVYRAADSRIMTMLILHRMRAEWLLWLAFTTEKDPYSTDRSKMARTADEALCKLLEAQLAAGL